MPRYFLLALDRQKAEIFSALKSWQKLRFWLWQKIKFIPRAK